MATAIKKKAHRKMPPTPPPPVQGIEVVKAYFNLPEKKENLEQILGKDNAAPFVAVVMQIVAANKHLCIANEESVYHAAETAASLRLSLNDNLQLAHLVPVESEGKWFGQFQIGWRGLVQLSIRSGYMKTVNVVEVRAGEIEQLDLMTGLHKFQFKEITERRSLPIIGYLSYFCTLAGFEKPLYKTVEELREHARTYSKGYEDKGGYWVTNEDGMCRKTVLKENLNKYAPLSADMALAIEKDQSVQIDEKLTYPDNPQNAKAGIGRVDKMKLSTDETMKAIQKKKRVGK